MWRNMSNTSLSNWASADLQEVPCLCIELVIVSLNLVSVCSAGGAMFVY